MTDELKNGPEESEHTDYLHLIYLFYRHPKKAFEIVNKGRAVHGIIAFIISVLVVYMIFHFIRSHIYNVYDGLFPFLNPCSISQDYTAFLPDMAVYFISFGMEAVILVIMLKLSGFGFQLKPALSVIFYSCAIAFPFIELWWSIDTAFNFFTGMSIDVAIGCLYYTGVDDLYYSPISYIFYIFAVPLAYLEYTGLKGMLKTRKHLILLLVLIAVIVQCILYQPLYDYIFDILL
ncbi:hypothetical protein J2128_002097 [Methanomicrobium sp. W14]|uniref:hypothetical protein n=1 Tax=Methanomicrobium sp. W14 TaxID=2817839 RepID=UPI001AE99DB4|nr:hypothetical protein [Methanomicrobium sp. W14]MBP2134131.1 hypothetical protein [Methanomicrobium sp. W14]